MIASTTLSLNATATEFKLVNGDGKTETQQCIDAVMNPNASMNENISCNGMSMRSFVSKYRMMKDFDSEKTIRVVTLEPQDSSFETALCVKAASSSGLKEIEAEHGKKLVKRVVCNGKSIERFAKSFRGTTAQ